MNSILAIIEDAYFDDWQNKINQADEGKHYEKMLKNRKLLLETATDETKAVLKNYTYSLETYYDIMLLNMCTKVLNEGIKIGMEVQKALSEE